MNIYDLDIKTAFHTSYFLNFKEYSRCPKKSWTGYVTAEETIIRQMESIPSKSVGISIGAYRTLAAILAVVPLSNLSNGMADEKWSLHLQLRIDWTNSRK